MVRLHSTAHLQAVLASLFDYLDPLRYMDEDAYRTMWMNIFHMMFQGSLARVGACLSLFYAFWYGTYKQKFGLGVLFFIFTMMFAYLGSVARFLGMGVQ
jgi:hypothetical protein